LQLNCQLRTLPAHQLNGSNGTSKQLGRFFAVSSATLGAGSARFQHWFALFALFLLN
jgi:hypothetical protein